MVKPKAAVPTRTTPLALRPQPSQTPTPPKPPKPSQPATSRKSPTRREATGSAKLLMPNERDESVAMTAGAPDPMVKQAAADVARGLQDTSKGAELNRAYTKLK